VDLHVTQSSSSQARYCQYCGKELTIEANFCLNCGKPIPQTPLPRYKIKVSLKNILKVVAYYIGLVLLADLFSPLFGFVPIPYFIAIGTMFLLIVFLCYVFFLRKKPFCPKCDKILASYSSDMTHCPYCGNVLERSFKKFCVYCGSGIARDGRFCPNCGKQQLKPEVGGSIG